MKTTLNQLATAGFNLADEGVGLVRITHTTPFWWFRCSKVHDVASLLEEAVGECGHVGTTDQLIPKPEEPTASTGFYYITKDQLEVLVSMKAMLDHQRAAKKMLDDVAAHPNSDEDVKNSPYRAVLVEQAEGAIGISEVIQMNIGKGTMKLHTLLANWITEA